MPTFEPITMILIIAFVAVRKIRISLKVVSIRKG